MSIGAAGGGTGPRVVDVGDERTGRGADHRLQVDASVRQRRDGQRSLPAQPGRQPGTGKPRHCEQTGEFNQTNELTTLTQDVLPPGGLEVTHTLKVNNFYIFVWVDNLFNVKKMCRNTRHPKRRLFKPGG